MGRLDGKIAIITGAARGTGEATARRFVAEGARVLLADILDERGETVAKDLGTAAIYARLDVSREADWSRAIDLVGTEFGPVDVLVNNAAILRMAALQETTLDDFMQVVTVNQLGTFLGMRAATPVMRERGGGSIVNISSIDGLEGMNGVTAYASSKWAVRGMTRVAALELGKYGIRVNTVCPGGGSFEMIEPYVKAAIEKIQQAQARGEKLPESGGDAHNAPLNHRTTMENIAAVILFLASDESAACTGSDYAVDAGYTAGKRIAGAPGA
jgi:3alpha(or 20beta)-hydroxysteroid dehydrogenase